MSPKTTEKEEPTQKQYHPARSLVYAKLNNLVMVPGHAVYVGCQPQHVGDIAYWKGTFQQGYRGHDEARLYTEHVMAGVLAAAADETSLLLFSGGQTREEVGPYSEAQSYWYLAEQKAWFDHLQVRERALTEDFARDSFENLLFSMYRFEQCTGRLPQEVTVCGFAFKKERYTDHYTAIKAEVSHLGLGPWVGKFTYLDANDPPYYRLHGLLGGEGSLDGEARTRNAFKKCPLGDQDDLLGKRVSRDPYCRGNPYRP